MSKTPFFSRPLRCELVPKDRSDAARFYAHIIFHEDDAILLSDVVDTGGSITRIVNAPFPTLDREDYDINVLGVSDATGQAFKDSMELITAVQNGEIIITDAYLYCVNVADEIVVYKQMPKPLPPPQFKGNLLLGCTKMNVYRYPGTRTLKVEDQETKASADVAMCDLGEYFA